MIPLDGFKQVKTAFLLLLLMTALTGLIYPAAVTLVAQLFFPYQANGSLIKKNNQWIGSQLIGQPFKSPYYFWGRSSESASGLDPDISPAAALSQIPRIAKARNLPPNRIQQIVLQAIQPRLWGILGEPHINVLQLNLELDARYAKTPSQS